MATSEPGSATIEPVVSRPASAITTPHAARTPLSGIRPRPLLASDALREDLAPLEPAARTARVLCLGSAVAFGVVAVLQVTLGGTSPLSLAPLQASVYAALLATLSIVPVSYSVRASTMIALGVSALLEGLLGLGPVADLRHVGEATFWELSRVLTCVSLPAALLFRAHYRAYPRARLLLGWGLAFALPFVIRSGYIIALGSEVSARVVAGATIGTVLLSLVGFMGAGTTAMSTVWAVSLLLALSLDIAARWFWLGASPGSHLVTSLAFLASAALSSVGVFQLLAATFACDARKIDVLCSRLEAND